MSDASDMFTATATGEDRPPVCLSVEVSADVAEWLASVAAALQPSDMGEDQAITPELAAGDLLEQMYLESAFGEDFKNKDDQGKYARNYYQD